MIRKKITQKEVCKVPLIDDKTIKGILQHPRFFRGHIKTATGKLYKTGEFEKRSDKVLGMRMP